MVATVAVEDSLFSLRGRALLLSLPIIPVIVKDSLAQESAQRRLPFEQIPSRYDSPTCAEPTSGANASPSYFSAQMTQF